MNKNLVKNIIVIILILWCILDLYSVPQITDLFELVMGFFAITLIPLVVLFFVSFSFKKCNGWQKIISLTGISISIITLIANVSMFIFDFIRQGHG
ncbi:MAG: hypothetical protein A2998_02135 [Candidatus Staskawiczbacteria bacterium RIFCSPLOWO2_01_FULL_37_25b]|uniref:Uncharacterized protein n=2 Tax=Candidatus Staskawicziibacteriota TaxID=1817916 RepID=A0A1G2HMQ2_9BACT|nr:MAG: hypothetical protein A2812_00280 [Candidatus Staskawiczbacteria bacterium RIFCSPHIGHO2_01_FULL_36_16]OGZ71900.1 MAG: hypothetical protein A2998_02135 [Candidatus Staskawiczbacteria bacterium RIFCSPLOWO2_01_FULL_37_25b]